MKTLLTLFVLFFSSFAYAGIFSHIGCYYRESRDLTLNSFGDHYGGLLYLLIIPVIFFVIKIIKKIKNFMSQNLLQTQNQNYILLRILL